MKKRLISGLLAVCILCGMLPTTFISAKAESNTTPYTSNTPLAGNGVDTYPALRYGVSGVLGWDKSTETYDYIYYGVWQNINDTEPLPLKWRVLSDKTNTNTDDGFFLMSEKFLGYKSGMVNTGGTVAATRGGIYFEKTGDKLGTHTTVNSGALLDILAGGSSSLVTIYTDYGYSTMYRTSDLRNWFSDFAGVTTDAYVGRNGMYIKGGVQPAFGSKELEAILETYKSDTAYVAAKNYYQMATSTLSYGNILNGDKVFAMSAEETEMEEYGFGGTNATEAERQRAAGEAAGGPINNAWLRSFTLPYDDGRMACVSQSIGGGVAVSSRFPNFIMDFSQDQGWTDMAGDWANDNGVRPAFNLSKDSIFMVKAADDRLNQPLTLIDNTTSTKEWKLVLKDSNAFEGRVTVDHATSGGILPVTHKALSAYANANYNNLTMTILDNKGNLIAYGSVSTDVNTTQTNIQLPQLKDGVYTIRLQAEQWSGAYCTDYSTADYYSITLPIYTPHFHDGVEWTPVSTLEELKAVGADDHVFLLNDLPEGWFNGHVCLNGYSSMEYKAEVQDATLYNCKDTGSLQGLLVLENGSLILKTATCDGTIYGESNSYAKILSYAQNISGITNLECTGTLGEISYAADIILHDSAVIEKSVAVGRTLEMRGLPEIGSYLYMYGVILITEPMKNTEPYKIKPNADWDGYFEDAVFTQGWAEHMAGENFEDYFQPYNYSCAITLDHTGELAYTKGGGGHDIIEQPTKENNYTVKINYPLDSSFQWYKAKQEQRWLTNEDDYCIYTVSDDIYARSSYDAEKGFWTIAWAETVMPVAYLRLNRGDTIRIYPVGDTYLEKVTLGNIPLVRKDGYWEITTVTDIPDTTLYFTYLKTPVEDVDGYKIQFLGDIPSDPLPGQTDAQLNTQGLPEGKYLCIVTWDFETWTLERTSEWVTLGQDELPTHEDHCACGGMGTIGDHTNCEAVTWTPWYSTSRVPTEPGNYYLVYDLVLEYSFEILADVNLCLNGKRVYIRSGNLELYGNHNVCDCVGNGAFDGSMRRSSGVLVSTHGVTNLFGIPFIDNAGAALVVRGTCNLYDCHISNNQGGGISNRGILSIYDGSVVNNTTNGDGGGIFNAYNATLRLYDCIISGNTAGGSGGGIYNETSNYDEPAIVEIYGALIINNTAGVLGGGIYNATLRYTDKPGVIRMDSGYVYVAHNTANGTKNNIYLAGGSVSLGDIYGSSSVGVSTANISKPVITNRSYRYTCFRCDDEAYEVYNSRADAAILLSKNHVCDQSYYVSGNVFYQSCSQCKRKESAELLPPAGTVYFTGTAQEPVILQCSANFKGDVVITYENNVNVGTATATATIAGVEGSISITFNIEKSPLVSASAFTLVQPTGAPYTGINLTGTVKALDGLEGMGQITAYHVVVEPGVYKIYINVAAGESHGEAFYLSDPSWVYGERVVFGIDKVTLRPGTEGLYFAGEFNISDTVSVERAGIAVSVYNKKPVADDSDPTCLWTNGTNSVLITDMLGDNKDGETIVYARAYVLTAAGEYLYGDVVATCLKDVVGVVDSKYSRYTAAQKTAVREMFYANEELMLTWELQDISDYVVTVIHRLWSVEDSRNGAYTTNNGSTVETVYTSVNYGQTQTFWCRNYNYYNPSVSNQTTTSTRDVTIVFDYPLKSYTLTLDAGEGKLPKNDASTYTKTVYHGEKITLFDTTRKTGSGHKAALAEYLPVRDGYLFYSWYNGTKRITDDITITGDVTLTADWVNARVTYTHDTIQVDASYEYNVFIYANRTISEEDWSKINEYGSKDALVKLNFRVQEIYDGYQEIKITYGVYSVLFEDDALDTAGDDKATVDYEVTDVIKYDESSILRGGAFLALLGAHGAGQDDYKFTAVITVTIQSQY